MSASTIIFIVRSLWPFLKEIVLRDKGFKEFIFSNLPASVLAACLIFVFGALYYISVVADSSLDRIKELEVLNQELSAKVTSPVLTGVTHTLTACQPSSETILPPKQQSQPRKDSRSPSTRRTLKSYVEDRLNEQP